MPELKIRPSLWNSLKAVAAKSGERPESVANRALAEFLSRQADEELLARSRKAARRAPLRIADTEKVIREYRRQK